MSISIDLGIGINKNSQYRIQPKQLVSPIPNSNHKRK